MIYTHKEKTVKDKTTSDAVSAARFILADRYKINNICTNAISHLDEMDKLTIEQMNELTDQIVDDSKYYNY